MTDATADVTQVLNAAFGSGDGCRAEELLPMLYDRLRRHAAAQLARESAAQTLQPTALVHEAWIRLAGGRRTWENRAHFFGAAAQAMRRILIESARRKARLKRGGNPQRADIDVFELSAASPDEKILMIDEALERLEQCDPEKAQIVTLKFFGGRTNREVADGLGVTERTVERQWAFAKVWLFRAIRAQR